MVAEHQAAKEVLDKETLALEESIANSQEEHHRLETEQQREKERLKQTLEKKLKEEEKEDGGMYIGPCSLYCNIGIDIHIFSEGTAILFV